MTKFIELTSRTSGKDIFQNIDDISRIEPESDGTETRVYLREGSSPGSYVVSEPYFSVRADLFRLCQN